MISNLNYPSPIAATPIAKGSVAIPLEKEHILAGSEANDSTPVGNPQIVLLQKGKKEKIGCRLETFAVRRQKILGSDAILVDQGSASEFFRIWDGPSTKIKIGTRELTAALPMCARDPEVQYGL